MQNITYLLSNAVHIYAVYILLNAVLGKSRLEKPYEILTYAVYFFVNSCIYLFIDNMSLNLISNILPVLLIMIQYKKTIQTAFFVTFGICAVGMFLDWLFSCINPHFVLINTSTVQSISFLGLVFIFRYYFKGKEKTLLNSRYIWFLILIAIGTIAVGELSDFELNFRAMLISTILLLINFLNFYLYDKYVETLQMKLTFNAIESSNKAYQNQMALVKDSQKRISLLRHDMKNHLLKIKYNLDNGNYDDASKYISEMTESISSNKEFVNTSNAEFDCLLNYKLAIAERMGTEISCNVLLPNELNVNSFDMTVILGNLLDNALNALKDANPKILNIMINYRGGMIVMVIENTFSDKAVKYDNPKEHGFGLISVKNSLKKYNGNLSYHIIENKYTSKVVIYNPQK